MSKDHFWTVFRHFLNYHKKAYICNQGNNFCSIVDFWSSLIHIILIWIIAFSNYFEVTFKLFGDNWCVRYVTKWCKKFCKSLNSFPFMPKTHFQLFLILLVVMAHVWKLRLIKFRQYGLVRYVTLRNAQNFFQLISNERNCKK